jgi:hypothetical protein
MTCGRSASPTAVFFWPSTITHEERRTRRSRSTGCSARRMTNSSVSRGGCRRRGGRPRRELQRAWTPATYSLSRLAIAPSVPKNAATFLLSRSIRLLPERWSCLITYADTWQNHTGHIYRCSGWEYLGETKKYAVWQIDGVLTSKKSAARNYSPDQMTERGAVLVGKFSKHAFRFIRKRKMKRPSVRKVG